MGKPAGSTLEQQMNDTLSKALSDLTQNLQRLNVTSMANQLMRNDPKLTFGGISRLEIPLSGSSFDTLNKITDQIPALNMFKP